MHQSVNYRHGSALVPSTTSFRSNFLPGHVRKTSSSGARPLTIKTNRGRRGDVAMNGFLNFGTPEVAVILAVGYFVLGPSDLYKLVKEAGERCDVKDRAQN